MIRSTWGLACALVAQVPSRVSKVHVWLQLHLNFIVKKMLICKIYDQTLPYVMLYQWETLCPQLLDVFFLLLFFFSPNSRYQVIHKGRNFTFVSPKQTFCFIKMHNKGFERMQSTRYMWVVF